MTTIQHLTIIYNPKSTGDSARAARELYSTVRQELPTMGVEMAPTQYAGHASGLAETIAQSRPGTLIVVAGGDGTYHEVINGLMEVPPARRPLCALLPTGNANDHHRALDPQRPILERIRQPKYVEITLLKLLVFGPQGRDLERYAHSYIGFGTSGQAAHSLNKETRGVVREKLVVVRELLRPRRFEIVHSGYVKRLYSLLCTQVEVMAKHLTVGPEVKLTDGDFVFTETPAISRAQLLRQVARSVQGAPPQPETADKLSFMLLTSVQAQLDGETAWLAQGSTVTVTAQPKALKTLV
jgi:diacylglycerol kinase (ATP)